MSWQRQAVERAVQYFERLIAAGAEDPETEETLCGLREVLNPRLRQVRLDRARELDQMDANGEKPSGIIS